MILRRLQIERFRNLSGIDLALPEAGTILVEGGNEAGKSSLVEAILFALYGRGVAPGDADDPCQVWLDFYADGEEFCVRRGTGSEPQLELACRSVQTLLTGADAERRLGETLGIGIDTLLSSRFLAQGDSDRLLGLSRQERDEAINELLGLSQLTALAKKVAPTADDQATGARLQGRLAIARLDQEGQALQERQQTARRTADLLRLVGIEAEIHRIERDAICPARSAMDDMAVRKREAGRRDDARRALATRKALLHDDLPLHLQTWHTAHAAQAEARAQVAERTARLDDRQSRQRRVHEGRPLAAQLTQLEEDERAADAADALLRDARSAWEERASLDAAFASGAEALARWQEERAAADQLLTEAEAALRERIAQRERLHRLGQLQLHLDSVARTRREAEELGERLRDAWERSRQLERLNARLTDLETIRAARAGREQVEGQRAAVCQLLDETRERLARSLERDAKIVEYEARLSALVVEATHREGVLAAIDASLRQADLRGALLAWADTAEHFASLASAQRRYAEAQERLVQFGQEKERVALARTLAARNVLAALNGTIHRLDREKRRIDERLKNLADELRVLQDMAPDRAMLAGLEHRLQTNAQAIERLEGLVPASPMEARERAIQLPEAGPERVRRRQVQEAVAQAQGEVQSTMRLLQQARQEIEDAPQLQERLGQLEAEANRLRVTLDEAETADPETLTQEWDSLQAERAIALAARQSLAELEDEERRLFERSEQEAADVAALAEEIGTSPPSVPSERERLQALLDAEPDEVREQQVAAARETLRDTEHALVQQELEQSQRLRLRSLTSRDELEAALRQAEEEARTLEDRIRQNASVRAALEALDLPTVSAALLPELAVLETDLTHAQSQAQERDAWKARLSDFEKSSKDARAAVARTWRQATGTSLPETPEAAWEQLPALQAEVQAAWAELDEAIEVPEDAAAQAETLRDLIAQGRAEQKRLRKEASMLRQRLELGAEDSPDQEAQTAADDPALWEAEEARSREALQENRRVRAELARIHAVVEEASLDPDVEAQALARFDAARSIHGRAAQIVARARETVAGRVWPLTLQNARALLVTLSDGHYSDVRWDDATDRLEVFDSRVQRFVDPQRCSGGVREQIGLAFRLAFALATQPGGRTGWLVIDDPVARFDPARVQTFIEMLTADQIRDRFAQVFLIARSDAIPPMRFDGRVRLAGGALVDVSF